MKIKETKVQVQNKQTNERTNEQTNKQTNRNNHTEQIHYNSTSEASSVTVPIDLGAKLSSSRVTGDPNLSKRRLCKEAKTLGFLCIQNQNPTNLVESASSYYSVSNSLTLAS